MDDEKTEPSATLARYFGEDEPNTQLIGQAKHFAHRRLGKNEGRRLINALGRLEKDKKKKKG